MKKIKRSNILILGFAFKEDCPDVRNTKVIDIIKELRDFGVYVDVYDPFIDWTDKSDSHTHRFINNPFELNKKYDASVVAVGHKQFKTYSKSDYENLSIGKSVIIDVKGIVDSPSWRL